jgi:hypothetical protein
MVRFLESGTRLRQVYFFPCAKGITRQEVLINGILSDMFKVTAEGEVIIYVLRDSRGTTQIVVAARHTW